VARDRFDPAEMERLIELAQQARADAYAPYSRFRVGAVVLTAGGRIFSGANVENASYAATVCAERNAVMQAVLAGERELRAVVIASDDAAMIFPCGICRQVLAEFAQPETVIICTRGDGSYLSFRIEELLPRPFRRSEPSGDTGASPPESGLVPVRTEPDWKED